MLENCKKLTKLIVKIGHHLQGIDQLLATEKYEEAQAKVEEVNNIIGEKDEFLKFRQLEIKNHYQINVEELTEKKEQHLRRFFWPVQLAGSEKDTLVFFTDSANVESFDLNGGGGWAARLPSIGGKQNKLLGYFWANRKAVFMRVSAADDPLLLAMGNEIGTVNITGNNLSPEIFCGDFFSGKMISSYDGKSLTATGNNIMLQRFGSPVNRPPRNIRQMKLSPSQNITYTFNDELNLEWWDNNTKSYGGSIFQTGTSHAYTVADFQPLSENRLLFAYANTIYLAKLDEGERVIIGESREKYFKIAVSPDEKYIYALTDWYKVDIFRMDDFSKITTFNLGKKLGIKKAKFGENSRVRFFDVGANNKLVIGVDDGRVLVMGV